MPLTEYAKKAIINGEAPFCIINDGVKVIYDSVSINRDDNIAKVKLKYGDKVVWEYLDIEWLDGNDLDIYIEGQMEIDLVKA